MNLKSRIRNKDLRRISSSLIFATIMIWAAWDFIPYITKAIGDTLSEIIQVSFYGNPPILFGWGFLNGHWVYRNGMYEMNAPIALSCVAIIVSSALAFAILQKDGAFSLSNVEAIIIFQVGMIAGCLAWPLYATS